MTLPKMTSSRWDKTEHPLLHQYKGFASALKTAEQNKNKMYLHILKVFLNSEGYENTTQSRKYIIEFLYIIGMWLESFAVKKHW